MRMHGILAAVALHRFADRFQQIGFLIGLFEEIDGAAFQRSAGMREIAVTGQKHDGQRAVALKQGLLQRQSIHAAHAQVEQQAAAPVRLPGVQTGFRTGEQTRAIATKIQQQRQRIAHGFVIVDDGDNRISHAWHLQSEE